jgi:hypothetical protein
MLFRENNELDKTPLIYHKTKLSICCWYLIMYKEQFLLYVSEDHERNRREYRMSAFATLNVIRKRVITKVLVE